VAGLVGSGKSGPNGVRTTASQVRSESLYRLRYPAAISLQIINLPRASALRGQRLCPSARPKRVNVITSFLPGESSRDSFRNVATSISIYPSLQANDVWDLRLPNLLFRHRLTQGMLGRNNKPLPTHKISRYICHE
jgi:hypothetical protein